LLQLDTVAVIADVHLFSNAFIANIPYCICTFYYKNLN
jgi:hypothetical protein